MSAIVAGSKVKIEKGCKALDIAKNVSAKVVEVKELGADHSHMVRVHIRFLNGFRSGKETFLYARHINRMGDTVINLNDGNPDHKVQIVRA